MLANHFHTCRDIKFQQREAGRGAMARLERTGNSHLKTGHASWYRPLARGTRGVSVESRILPR